MKNFFFIFALLSSSLYSMSKTTLNYSLIEVAQKGTEEEVRKLLEQGADPLSGPSMTFNLQTPLMVALNSHNAQVIDILSAYEFVKQATMRDRSGYALIHHVAANHDMGLLKPLKKLGVEINDQNNIARETPLHCAIESNREDKKKQLKMIEELLASGANPMLENSSEENAFCIARRKDWDMKNAILELLQSSSVRS